MKDGFIVVNFDIKVYKYNATNNSYSLYLRYNDPARNMWQKEGYSLTKKDYLGHTFQLNYGDVVFYYTMYQNNIKTNADSDYQTGGTH